ncbi:trehalose 6-phosphatase [Saccharopolyspora erythraea NRRL 2338]|uniref:Trehalose 6-phosphate phosphatase n=2 Tax=Saccharopolyspora erythraea TaxID=1836 RepID=A0ABN1CJ56_SACER|nr:trehalose-phosphatase [Saccharopolyspora erythraea]PFG96680.1 trehalose 6-phosphatase [Saccharopolyspora erythraea NRRL 2338]QRK93156.1 trehalose-phosphatase [Saccharopolyspora erythraea]
MARADVDPRRHRAVLVDGGLVGGRGRAGEGGADLIEALRRCDVRIAVVSAVRDSPVLERSGTTGALDASGAGPDPGPWVEAARRLGVSAVEAVVVAGVPAAVEAVRAGGFGLVVGVGGEQDRLWRAGADVVVGALREISVGGVQPGARPMSEVPDALERWDEFAARLRRGRVVLLCDFDGTLAPIGDVPGEVALPVRTREVLEELARHCPAGVLSGRDLDDVRGRVGIGELWYAGSHGFEIAGPAEQVFAHPAGEAALGDLDEAQRRVSESLAGVPGVLVDRKRFGLAVHYRMVEAGMADHVVSVVRGIGDDLAHLKMKHGRLVAELLPDVDWHKGRALSWLLEELGAVGAEGFVPVFVGDDFTDEDALRVVRDGGVGVVVRSGEHGDRPTWAHYAVAGPESLGALLGRVAELVGGSAR